jgi:6-phospho-beta-glucosidase
MAKALRTIPVILALARDVQALAPGALLVNFTNPAGLVTEALQRYAPEVTAVGVCNVPITTKMGLIKLLSEGLGQAIDPAQAELDTLGLNHLSWHRGLKLDGEDIWPRAWTAIMEKAGAAAEPEWDVATLEALRMLPNPYLQYFYYTARRLEKQAHWPPSRAEQVMAIEAELLAYYADPANREPPPGLMQRGGAYYSTVATQLLDAHYNGRGETHIVNTRHAGAVPGWPADWVLELPCRVDRTGVHPLPAEPLPRACYELLARVKQYELLTVEAAVHGDRHAAEEALVTNPLGPTAERAPAVLDDLLRTHAAHLPQFQV